MTCPCAKTFPPHPMLLPVSSFFIIAALPATARSYGLLTPEHKAPGIRGENLLSELVSGPTLRVAYGNGKVVGFPKTIGPSIIAEPLTLVAPSPVAGQIPVPTFSCPPTLASSKLNDIFIQYYLLFELPDHQP